MTSEPRDGTDHDQDDDLSEDVASDESSVDDAGPGGRSKASGEIAEGFGTSLLTPQDAADETDHRDASGGGTGDVVRYMPEPRDDDFVSYQLHQWALESRVMTESLLTAEQISHAWEGATLVVRTTDQADTEGILDEVVASERKGLDPDLDKVAYEISGWPVDHQHQIVEALTNENVPYSFDDDGDLLVYETDDARVEKIFDDLDLDEVSEDDEVDGLAVHAVLTELFVSAGRLKKDARDANGVLAMAKASNEAKSLPLPFGFDPNGWREFIDEVSGMRALLESDDSTDEDVAEQATVLHDRLRPIL